MELRSPAFFIGSTLPYQYTCDGENISPPLQWEAPPEGTRSFALILSDPDAPNQEFTHWVLYNLPADCRKLPENIPPDQPVLEDGTIQGKNSRNQLGYFGACPPSGTHRYYFKLFALDRSLDLKPGATKAELLQAMEGHVLESFELMSRYARQTKADF